MRRVAVQALLCIALRARAAGGYRSTVCFAGYARYQAKNGGQAISGRYRIALQALRPNLRKTADVIVRKKGSDGDLDHEAAVAGFAGRVA